MSTSPWLGHEYSPPGCRPRVQNAGSRPWALGILIDASMRTGGVTDCLPMLTTRALVKLYGARLRSGGYSRRAVMFSEPLNWLALFQEFV